MPSRPSLSLTALPGSILAFATRRPWPASFIVVTLAALISMLFIDRTLANFYRYMAEPETVTGFRFIGNLGLSPKYYIGLPVLVLCLRAAMPFCLRLETAEKLRRLSNLFLYMLLSLAASAVPTYTIKFTIGRFRPLGLFDADLFGIDFFTYGYLNSSFPSGHSQAIWSLAIALLLAYPRYDAAYLIVATLVSYSRVVTYDHYLSDVMFGSYIGIASAILVKRHLFDRRGIPVGFPMRRMTGSED